MNEVYIVGLPYMSVEFILMHVQLTTIYNSSRKRDEECREQSIPKCTSQVTVTSSIIRNNALNHPTIDNDLGVIPLKPAIVISNVTHWSRRIFNDGRLLSIDI